MISPPSLGLNDPVFYHTEITRDGESGTLHFSTPRICYVVLKVSALSGLFHIFLHISFSLQKAVLNTGHLLFSNLTQEQTTQGPRANTEDKPVTISF